MRVAADFSITCERAGVVAYESALGWNPAVQDHNEAAQDESYLPTTQGYTKLEECLHFKIIPHAITVGSSGAAVEMVLSRYTVGFFRSVEFRLSEVTAAR